MEGHVHLEPMDNHIHDYQLLVVGCSLVPVYSNNISKYTIKILANFNHAKALVGFHIIDLLTILTIPSLSRIMFPNGSL